MRPLAVLLLVAFSALAVPQAEASYCHDPPARCAAALSAVCPKDACMEQRVKTIDFYPYKVRAWLTFEAEIPVAGDDPEGMAAIQGHVFARADGGRPSPGHLHMEVSWLDEKAARMEVPVLFIGGMAGGIEWLTEQGPQPYVDGHGLLAPGQAYRTSFAFQPGQPNAYELPFGFIMDPDGRAQGGNSSLYFVASDISDGTAVWDTPWATLAVTFAAGCVVGALVVWWSRR
jgi:hypothetical protein